MQFLVLWGMRDTPCFLQITHTPHARSRTRKVEPGRTRVRVDSLELQQVSIDQFAARVLSAPRKFHGAVAFTHRCLNCSNT